MWVVITLGKIMPARVHRRTLRAAIFNVNADYTGISTFVKINWVYIYEDRYATYLYVCYTYDLSDGRSPHLFHTPDSIGKIIPAL